MIADKDQNQLLAKYIPEDAISPKGYIELVKSQALGVDKNGKERPFQDLLYFMHVSKKTGLDPVAKQIYAVYRWDSRIGAEKMGIQTSIDGFRLVAQRTGVYAGVDDIAYDSENEETTPKKATATVYKIVDGQRVSFSATARWSEFVQLGKDNKPMGLWAKMPYHMLGKCAEALALRKAFPQELSGLYTEDEIGASKGIDLPTPEKFEKKEVVQEVEEVNEPEATPEVAQEIFSPESNSEEIATNLIAKREALRNKN